tara:strand:- start:361 stop:474 length:114 start_codon:yes stop_codon:yes gene_type:complete
VRFEGGIPVDRLFLLPLIKKKNKSIHFALVDHDDENG